MTFKIGFMRIQSGHIFNENDIVITDVVSDVAYSRKSVNTRVIITLFKTTRYPLENSDVI